MRRPPIRLVLAEVADDPAAAALELGIEKASAKPRKTLISKLERIIRTNTRPGPNATALEQALVALAVGPEHAALVAGCRSLAAQVDQEGFNDKAWREYRLLLKQLMEVTAGGGADDPFETALAEMRATMGDTTNAGS